MIELSPIKDGGGRAFPAAATNLTFASSGMTLRDYFAAKAMQGFLASGVNAPANVFATKAYALADAMLEERQA